jgi:L-ribulose-5-phosphate 3-epimerase
MEISRRKFINQTGLAVAGLSLAGTAQAINTDSLRMKHPICLFSKHLQFLGFEELSEALAKIGFDGIDLTVRKGGHIEPEHVKQELPKAIKAAAKGGIAIPMMTTRIVNAEDKFTAETLAVAADNGITHYRMGAIDYDPSKSIQQNIDFQKTQFEKLDKLNRKYKIHGGFQNHWGAKFGSPVWDLYSVLKEVESEWTGCQYDVRHAVVEGGASWILGMKAVAPFITSAVFKDFIWNKENGKWKPVSVPLGTGMVDFVAYFEEFKKLKNVAPVSLHYEYGIGLGKILGDRIPSKNEIIEFYQPDLEILKEMMVRAGVK